MARQRQHRGAQTVVHRLPVGLLAGLCLVLADPCSAGVLFMAHFDGATSDADHALGASSSTRISRITKDGRWGGALDLKDAGGHVVYPARGNLNPYRGTAELWFIIDKDEQDMFHPLIGWYNPPKEKENAFEVYVRGNHVRLNVHAPRHAGFFGQTTAVDGQWHHLEINWDTTTGGDAASTVFTVYIDGKTVIEYTKPQLDENDKDAQKLLKGQPKLLDGGYISLQSESHPVEFRKVELLRLKP